MTSYLHFNSARDRSFNKKFISDYQQELFQDCNRNKPRHSSFAAPPPVCDNNNKTYNDQTCKWSSNMEHML